jgi:hypothetical protein
MEPGDRIYEQGNLGGIEIRSPGVISMFLIFIENCCWFSFPVAMVAAILYETQNKRLKNSPLERT